MTLTTTLARVGLEVVLEGLGDFRQGLGQANRLIDTFAKGGREVEKSFRPVNKVLAAFVESLRRIAEFVVAGIIVRGFEKITSAIRGMVEAMVTAGAEFQTLTVRLEGLLAREILDTGQVKNFTEALQLAGPAAEDLFGWIQQLALTTPFDIQDVAETITFAKAYGFAADNAKVVTAAIIDFASGMGLTSVQMKRIIENFGQMIQQGKVTSTELRDLGRGALVPINRILEVMQGNLGVTTEKFLDMKKAGELEVMPFIDAFIQVVGTDFPDAGRRASRTITAVVGNMKDLVQGILGFNVVRPVLDVIAEKMANMLDALTTGERGEKLISLAKGIGDSLVFIMEAILTFFGGSEAVAEGIISFIEKFDESLSRFAERVDSALRFLKDEGLIATLVEFDIISPGVAEIAEKIANAIGFLKDEGLVPTLVEFDIIDVGQAEAFLSTLDDIIETAKKAIAFAGEEGVLRLAFEFFPPGTSVGNFIIDIQTALENLQIFWTQNKDQILGIIDSLLGSLLKTGQVGGETLLEVLGAQLVRFSEILVKDGPKILDIVERLADHIGNNLIPKLMAFSDWIIRNQDTIINFFIGLEILGKVIKLIIAFAAAVFLLGTPLGQLFTFLVGIGVLTATFHESISLFLHLLGQLFLIITLIIDKAVRELGGIFGFLGTLGVMLQNTMGALGFNAMLAFASSFFRVFDWFKASIWDRFMGFIAAVKWWLGIRSPSSVFEKLGKQTVEGYAKGIMDAFKLPEAAMRVAVAHTLAPAVNAMAPGVTGTTMNTTNNFTLNVNSSAQREPLIADFRQLESLSTLR
jgi:tape measure domain-containing protein